MDGDLKKDVAPGEVGKFYDSSCYIVLYTYQGEERKEEYLLCNWIGRQSSLVSVKSKYQNFSPFWIKLHSDFLRSDSSF